MRYRIIKAYFKKELIDLLRNKMIVLVYLLPVMILFLFGYGLKMEVTHARTIILDYDNSKTSLNLIEKFTHSKYFDTKVLYISEQKALRDIKKANTDILIIIPNGFEKRLLHRQTSEIGVFVDGAFPMRATIMKGYVEGVILNYFKNKDNLVKINQRNLFNESLRDENAIIPGVIGIVLFIAPAIISALMIVKEKEIGTIFNFYSSSITKSEFLVAKLTPLFLFHTINIFILFLIATYIFKVPFKGNFLLYFIASEIYISVSIALGLLVSILTSKQVTALVIVILITIIPAFLYSGMLMPISSMSNESYIEAHIFPVMYYNHIVYDTFLVGNGFSLVNIEYLMILLFYSFGLFLLGWILLKKRLR